MGRQKQKDDVERIKDGRLVIGQQWHAGAGIRVPQRDAPRTQLLGRKLPPRPELEQRRAPKERLDPKNKRPIEHERQDQQPMPLVLAEYSHPFEVSRVHRSASDRDDWDRVRCSPSLKLHYRLDFTVPEVDLRMV